MQHEFAQAVGAPHAVAVNSATAALHLALTALDIGADDEVIAPVYASLRPLRSSSIAARDRCLST